MKIIMVAPIHKEKDFLKQKKILPFLYGQGQQSWYEALKNLGHEVFVFRYSDTYLIPNNPRIYISTFFSTYFPIWKARFNRYSQKLNLFWFDDYVKNKRFIRMCMKIKPDLILVSGGLYGVNPASLKLVKRIFQSKAILLSGVNPKYGASAYDKKLIKENFFDYIFVNDEGYCQNWRKTGAHNVAVLPISSCDLNVHKKYLLTSREKKEYESDVCFIGTLSTDRQKILSNLTNFKIKIWGDIPPGVNLFSSLRPFYFGKAQGAKMVKIYNAAKIVLNIHAEDMRYGGNMKTFEIPACGAFQLIDNVRSSWFKDGEEIIIYKSIGSLKEKINYYLKHDLERKKIAEAGFRRARRDHTYKKHLGRIFKILYDISRIPSSSLMN